MPHLIVTNWWEVKFEPLSPTSSTFNALVVVTSPKAVVKEKGLVSSINKILNLSYVKALSILLSSDQIDREE